METDRQLELVGDNFIKCDRNCGIFDGVDLSLRVDRETRRVTVCRREGASIRGSTHPKLGSDIVENFRICLVNQVDVDLDATIGPSLNSKYIGFQEATRERDLLTAK